MRFLLINYEYPPLGGGTGIANRYLLEQFAKENDLQLDVLCSSPYKERVETYSKNIRLFRLNIGKKNRNLHHQANGNLISFFIRSTLWVFAHKKNYDLIHAFSGLPGGVTAWLSGKPYLVSFRGADEPGYEPRHELVWKLLKPAMGHIYRHARSLDANSQFLKRLVLKSWADLSIKVIRNGVDTDKFYPAKKKPLKKIILATSRLAPRKGIDYLIKAMQVVAKKEPHAKLWLAGEGVEQEKLVKLAERLGVENKVKFLSRVDHNKLPDIYRQAKIFVLPSLSESFSNSLLEALACGLPVVATSGGGNREMVNKQNGFLVPPANSWALTEAIYKALNQSWPKINLKRKLSWKKTAKSYLELYQNKA